jgi:putative sterol carrier protein
MADALITMSADTASQLASGSLTAARAIELGRLKVRGDGNVLPTIAPLLSATLGAE